MITFFLVSFFVFIFSDYVLTKAEKVKAQNEIRYMDECDKREEAVLRKVLSEFFSKK